MLLLRLSRELLDKGHRLLHDLLLLESLLLLLLFLGLFVDNLLGGSGLNVTLHEVRQGHLLAPPALRSGSNVAGALFVVVDHLHVPVHPAHCCELLVANGAYVILLVHYAVLGRSVHVQVVLDGRSVVALVAGMRLLPGVG